MRVIIHKGTGEIGGSCIELKYGNHSILLDIGMPLEGSFDLVKVKELAPDAVLISHPHQDHYGLVEGIDRNVPIYLSELSKQLIEAARIFSGQPLLENGFRFFKPGDPFSIGPFKVTPYLMDHSSPDSFAFLVEAEGSRVLYSGDFRAHGRKNACFERFIQNPPHNIDLLLMEGTMLERSSDDFPDEQSVEEKMFEVLGNQHNASFIICSSQNIDRMVSAFRACKRADKSLVVDLYTAWVLEQMKLVSERVPSMSWEGVRVYIPNKQYQVIKDNSEFFAGFKGEAFQAEVRIQAEELFYSPQDYLQAIRLSGIGSVARYLGGEPVNIIYSQWLGYLEDKSHLSYGAQELAKLRFDPRVNFVYAHSSGHAALEDLKRFAASVRPKMLIPIHTEHKELFPAFFDNVILLEDGQEIDLQQR